MTLWIATVETRSWTFEGCSTTETGARTICRVGFEKYMRALGGTLRWSEVTGDVQTRTVTSGHAYVDGTPVPT